MDFDAVLDPINPYKEPVKKYDIASSFYHLIMGVWEIKTNVIAMRMADIKKNEKVLDLACGTCWVAQKLIERANILAVDMSEGMINECKKRIGNENAIVANAMHLPFKNHSFDVVFSSFFLDLLPENEIQNAIEEMKRVVKMDGRIVAVSMSKYGCCFKKMARMLYELAYLVWPTIKGYRPSSRPIKLRHEFKLAGMKIKKYVITTIPLFHFPVEIVVTTY